MKPVCTKCERFFKPVKIGVYFVEQMPKNGTAPRPGLTDRQYWKPYKVWSGDLYRCEGCGTELIYGTGMKPLAQHHEPTFAKTMGNVKPEYFVNDV